MKTILIIDDEPRIRDIYSRLLAEKGFKVLDAFNVRTAHKILNEEKISLVLLDINMPVVDGTSVYTLLKTQYPDIRIIVTSVYSLDEQKKQIEEADDYFDKSDSISNLLQKIDRVLEKTED